MKQAEQFEREYRDALDGLRFSDAGKERMMENLMEQQGQKPAKRRGVRPLRAALIAAAVCVALVGTVFAAHYAGVNVVEGDNGVTYWQGGVAYYPYDGLSDEIKGLDGLQDVGKGHLVKAVDSWQAAEDFVGFDLMDNPVLDASPATHYSHIYMGVWGDYLVATYPDLSCVRVYGCYEIGETNIMIEAFLFTDRQAALEEDWNERFLGYDFNHIEGTQVVRESYTASSGLEAQILEITRPGKDGASYKAAVSINGIPAVISVTDGDAYTVLLQVLDGFVLE